MDGVSVGAVTTYTFTNVQSNHTIDATFTTGPTRSRRPRADGTIVPPGRSSVACGDSLRYTITPICYKVSDVKVDGVSVGAVTSYTFRNVHDESHDRRAVRARGSVQHRGDRGCGWLDRTCRRTYVPCGGNQTYTITPGACRQIADVKVDGVSVGPVATYTFTNVQANHTIAATFSVINYTIVATAGPGGTIDPSGNVVVACGTNKTFTIEPNPGGVILDVEVDGIPQGPVSSYTFTNVQTNHTIHATFTDLAPPEVRLIYPNGGENLFINDPTKIAWTTSTTSSCRRSISTSRVTAMPVRGS